MFFKREEDINKAWLKESSEDIKYGRKTMIEVCKTAKFDTIFGIKELEISISKYKTMCKSNGISLFQVGRKDKSKYIDEQIKSTITKLYHQLHIGVRKMHELLNDKHMIVSRRQIEAVYAEIAPERKKEKINKIYRCKYCANNINSIWHGDIHYLNYFNERRYIFALMDDCSRFIVGFSIGTNKDADLVLTCFIETESTVGRAPLIYWSDNGKENLAQSVQSHLAENNIKHVRTRPRNPQSNGKIERFWPTLEAGIKNSVSWEDLYDKVDSFIYYYNNERRHLGLPKDFNGHHYRPCDIYFQPELEATSRQCTIEIDGMNKSLKEFCKEESNSDMIESLKIENLLN